MVFSDFQSALEYSFTTQIHLIFNVTVLHNFICKYQFYEDIYDREELQVEREHKEKDNEKDIKTKANLVKGDRKKMNEYQDKMAEKRWTKYIHR